MEEELKESEVLKNAIRQEKEIEAAEKKLVEESPVEEVTSPKKKVKYRNLFGWG